MALPLVGCGQKAVPPVLPERADACRLFPEAAEPLDTLTVVLTDSAASHDAVLTNPPERLLSTRRLETLLRLDCNGQPLPGLARTWTADRTGRVWTFVLAGVPSSDRPSETAFRVASAWRALDPEALRQIGIETVVVGNGDSLIVTLNELAHSAPHLFADPALAATPPVTGAPSPTIVELPVEPGSDHRDALDRGGDLIVTRDPALLEYMEGRPEFTAFSLPWTRTYVLLQPPGAEQLGLGLAATERRSLARDAVSADARAAEPPFWWVGTEKCPQRAAPPPTSRSARIVYSRGDAVARGLAERIVALEGAGTGLRAAGLEPAEFATRLGSGSERGYVLALPKNSLAPCRDVAALPHGALLRPLIETRSHVIARKGVPPLTVDWDGSIRVAPQ